MARTNNKGEIFESITEVGVFRDASGGGATTVGGTAPTVGTKDAVTLASATNFAIGDFIRIGSLLAKPMLNKAANLVTTTLTPLFTHRHAIAVGDAVVEQSKLPLKHVGGPPRLTISGSQTAVMAEERVLPIGYLDGVRKCELAFELLPWNLNNLLAALGMRDADAAENISGSGTLAAPHRAFIDGSKFREVNLLAWYVTGRAKSGRTIEVIATGCEINPGALQQLWQRGSRTTIPIRLVPTTGVLWTEVD